MRPCSISTLATRASRAAGPALVAFCLSAAPLGAAHATLSSISVTPALPVSCDSVAIHVSGAVSTCGNVIRTGLTGPVPEDVGGILVRRFDVSIVVQDPNPMLMSPCPSGNPPYAYDAPVGLLAPGPYVVRAIEYLVRFTADGSGAPYDSTVLEFPFAVAPGDSCPRPTCALLDFLPADGGPTPTPPPGQVGCDTRVSPGGTGCFAIGLGNSAPVGGVQATFSVADMTLGPLPAGTFTPVSVETTERSKEFTVSWTASGATVTALLYSATGGTIAPGSGPILRVCYAVSSDTREIAYPLVFGPTLVADANGVEIPPCPTIAMIQGWFCVGSPPACDLNADGRSDVRDVILLARCALEGAGSDACPDSLASRADCDGDSALDVRDVVCCVRKILAAGLPPPPAGDTLGGTPTRIGFAGPATWGDATDGRAVIEIVPSPGFGGAQFVITPGAGIRIRDVSLDTGGILAALDWSAGNDGSARVILYGLAGPINPPSLASGAAVPPIRVAVDIEPSNGASAPASTLALGSLGGADWDGAAAPAEAIEATAGVPATSVPAPSVARARPNPFAGETEISFVLPRGAHVSLRLYDVSGRLVRTLVDGARDAGLYHARWDGRNDAGATVVSGVYFMRFDAGGITRSDRILKLR